MMSLAAIAVLLYRRVALTSRWHAGDRAFVLAQDEVLDAVELDLGAGVLAEQDAVALLDVERTLRTLSSDLAVADRDDLALDGLLLGRVGDDDAALGLLFFGRRLTTIRSCSGRIFMTMSPPSNGSAKKLALTESEC